VADRKVPLGISTITILMFIYAVLDIAAGALFLIEKGPVAEAADMSESTIVATAIGLLVSGVIIGLLAFGLRSASNGVRLVIAVVMVLRIAGAIYVIFAIPGGRSEGVVGAVVALVVLYFLYGREDSKAFFEGRPSMT
jgi:hypothetical protein